MNLSMRWLADYTKIGEMKIRDFCEAMTMSGSKVETWGAEGDEIKNVVVGRVDAIERHPDSDHLWVCQVDAGAGAIQIVTGAQNVRKGDLVPVALHNSRLPGGKEIKKGKLRGVESDGMLCSLGELGLTLHDFPYAIEDGIFILQEDCRPGDDIRAALGFDDTTVDFEITPNRPDCLSIIGLAREAAATFKTPLTVKTPAVKGGAGKIEDLLKVRVENETLCPRYMAAVVRDIRVGPSPRWMRERLRACGVRPINNIVDITNFVMLEYGQPMHAFDLDLVEGGQIVVRNARAGESITTLEGTEHKLSPEMLVIADSKKPSAVAGVMGGEASGINDRTRTVVFESANFKGSSVRVTARDLGLRTESSGRFEKGLDPQNCRPALARACELVETLGAGDVCDGFIDIDHSDKTPTRIPFDPDWINRFLGTEIPAEQMETYFGPLDIRLEGGYAVAPSYRADLKVKADLAEEVARMYGYDRVPTAALKGFAQGSYTPRQVFDRRTADTALALGYSEIITYSFISPKLYDKLRLPEKSPLRRSIVISNPLGEDTSIMRTTSLASLLEVMARNYNNRNPAVRLFEMATAYLPTADDKLPAEKPQLTLGSYGEQEDFYALKGSVEALLAKLGVRGAEYAACADDPTFHPGRCAVITCAGKEIGVVGELHPKTAENFGIGCRAYAAMLDGDSLWELRAPEAVYVPLPRFPASTRDLAVLCDEQVPVAELEKAISRGAGKLLERIELFDVYQGEQVPAGKKSAAFALVLRAPDRTLTVEDCDKTVERVLAELKKLGAELRS